MPQALSPHGGSSDLATAMAPVLKEATEASSRGDRLTAQDVAPPAGAILVNPTELGVLTQTVLDISKCAPGRTRRTPLASPLPSSATRPFFRL